MFEFDRYKYIYTYMDGCYKMRDNMADGMESMNSI